MQYLVLRSYTHDYPPPRGAFFMPERSVTLSEVSLADELSRLNPRKPKLAEYILSLNAEDRQTLDSYLLDPLVPIEGLVPILRKRCQCTRESLQAWREKHVAR